MINIGGRGMLGLLNRGCWHAVVLRCPVSVSVSVKTIVQSVNSSVSCVQLSHLITSPPWIKGKWLSTTRNQCQCLMGSLRNLWTRAVPNIHFIFGTALLWTNTQTTNMLTVRMIPVESKSWRMKEQDREIIQGGRPDGTVSGRMWSVVFWPVPKGCTF